MRPYFAAALSIFSLTTVILAQAPTPDPKKEALVVFKDGFSIKGKVKRQFDFLVDPLTGSNFRIPSGTFYVDDGVRKYNFDPSQAHDVIDLQKDPKDTMVIARTGYTRASKVILPGWELGSASPWDSKWERTIPVSTPNGKFDMYQRIAALSPHVFSVFTKHYQWDLHYLTPEFGPAPVRDLLVKYYDGKKDLSDADKSLIYAKFFRQGGMLAAAELELMAAIKRFPNDKEKLQPALDDLHKLQANLFVEDMERAHKVGQHKLLAEKLAFYEKINVAEKVTEQNRLAASDWKAKYENAQKQFEAAKTYLTELQTELPKIDYWKKPTETILQELNVDTLGRLEPFLTFAAQHQTDVKAGRKPSQNAEEVLALAVTGWHLGGAAAQTDISLAKKTYEARLFLQKYLKSDDDAVRNQMIPLYTRDVDLPIDQLARILKNLPPISPHDKIDATIQKITTDIAGVRKNIDYNLLLPPEYNPMRSYPVMVLLQSPRDKTTDMISRLGEEAAKHGFILAAPQWGTGFRYSYNHSAAEHEVVQTTLRDLRRRFNIDSDRVFLFGWEGGGDMALDVGLSHPDLFAGIITKNANSKTFPQRYWPNGQFLPFYVIDGDRSGITAKGARTLFKDWISNHYPSIYVEYRGRSSEWFQGEVPVFFDWASRKKRYHPLKELGRPYAGRTLGEEFRIMRLGDGRFYWLSTDDISERHQNDADHWVASRQPATLQASISIGNEADLKKGARIWTQINVRTNGVRQATIWLTPTMLDYAKPVQVRVNGNLISGVRSVTPNLSTMLEEVVHSGDRHRLYYAKINLKL